ncbi:MAG: hypothetical protein ACJ73E_00140 [Mycobacteriales bacterium]
MQQRPPHRPEDEPGQPSDAVRVQILATEHWSLLATRPMLWGEAFSRATMFLTALSAAVVALALIAQAAGEEETFTLFVVLLLPVMLVVGLATYLRINKINEEDERLVAGMNRPRRGYLDIAPDLERYFMTDFHDDRLGVALTSGVGIEDDPFRRFVMQVIGSTPGLVGLIEAVVAGALVGLVAVVLGLPALVAVLAGMAIGFAVLAGLIVASTRTAHRALARYTSRFPTER